jgi:hypothetical protein
MKKSLYLLLFIITIVNAKAQKSFPQLQCENTNGVVVDFPKSVLGKFTLVGVALSKDSEEMLQTWINPLYNKFVASKKNSQKNIFDPSFSYDIHLFFIPMFTGINQVAAKQAKEKIISKTSKEFLPNLLFYQGENPQKTMGIEQRDVPYFFVLDKEGKIKTSVSGKFDEKKLEKLQMLWNLQ